MMLHMPTTFNLHKQAPSEMHLAIYTNATISCLLYDRVTKKVPEAMLQHLGIFCAKLQTHVL